MIRLLQIPALILILVITTMHAHRFNANKPVGPWWHLWWSCIYGIPCGIAVWQFGWNWWLAGAFVLERFVFYNPILNFKRDPRRPFFYITAKNSKPGFWDKIETWMAGFYPYTWGLGALGFITIQFFIDG
jgi:hypothetical protein